MSFVAMSMASPRTDLRLELEKGFPNIGHVPIGALHVDRTIRFGDRRGAAAEPPAMPVGFPLGRPPTGCRRELRQGKPCIQNRKAIAISSTPVQSRVHLRSRRLRARSVGVPW